MAAAAAAAGVILPDIARIVEEGPPLNIAINPAALCTIAKSDAKHDYGGGIIPKLLDTTIPIIGDCTPVNENNILNLLGITNEGGVFDITHFKDPYKNVYIHTHCNVGNLDATLLSYFSVLPALGLVVDAYTEAFRTFCENLKSLPSSDRLIYYWVENTETLYDPAPKTNINTNVGKLIHGDYLKFASEIKPNSGLSQPVIHKSYTGNPLTTSNRNGKEYLFYSNYNITQFSSTKGESITVISDKTNPANIKEFIVNADAAEINQKNFDYDTYCRLQNSPYRNAITNALNLSIANPMKAIYISIINQYKYPLKRLGDQGQALSCLRPITANVDSTGTTITFDYNLCFVTHDRIAFTSAIIYGVPAAIYCQQNGNFELFINRTYINPELLLTNAKRKYTELYNLYGTKLAEFNAYMAQYTALETSIYTSINKEIRAYLTILNTYNGINYTPAQLNEMYKLFFKQLYNFRGDILNYYATINNPKPIDNYTPFFYLLEANNNINDINTHYSELSNSYSSLTAQLEFITTLLNKYVTDGRGNISRNPIYSEDAYINDVKLNTLALFTAIREERAERIFESQVSLKAGLDYIHEYANALYNYTSDDTYQVFLQVFKTIIEIIKNYDTFSPTVKALGNILEYRIRNNESYKKYIKENPKIFGGRRNVTYKFKKIGGVRNRRNRTKKTITIRKHLNPNTPSTGDETFFYFDEKCALETYLLLLKNYACTLLHLDMVGNISGDYDNDTTIKSYYLNNTDVNAEMLGAPVTNMVLEVEDYYIPRYSSNLMKHTLVNHDEYAFAYNTIVYYYNQRNLDGILSVVIPTPTLLASQAMAKKYTNVTEKLRYKRAPDHISFKKNPYKKQPNVYPAVNPAVLKLIYKHNPRLSSLQTRKYGRNLYSNIVNTRRWYKA